MVPDSRMRHLKQQMSVTLASLDPQKVHKVGQLSGWSLLVLLFSWWHLG